MGKKLSYLKKGGKLQLVRTETIELGDDEILQRLQELQNRLTNCQANIERLQQTEEAIKEEMTVLKTALANQTQPQ